MRIPSPGRDVVDARGKVDIDYFAKAVLTGQIIAEAQFVRHLQRNVDAGMAHIAIDDNSALARPGGQGGDRQRRRGFSFGRYRRRHQYGLWRMVDIRKQ